MPPNKFLVALVVFLGIVLLGGLGVLAFGLVMRASDPDFKLLARDGASPLLGEGDQFIKIPPGSRLISVSTAGAALVLHIRDAAGGDAVLIADPETGEVRRRLKIAPGP